MLEEDRSGTDGNMTGEAWNIPVASGTEKGTKSKGNGEQNLV